MSPSEDKITDILLDIKEDIGEIRGESTVIRKQVDDMYTAMRTEAAEGCIVARENKKKISRLQAIIYSASAAISGVVSKLFG